MPDCSTNDQIRVTIPKCSIVTMAKSFPDVVGGVVTSYRNCGFVREQDDEAEYFAYVGMNPPPTFSNTFWRRATAREAVWLVICSHQRQQPDTFDQELITSSEMVPFLNHLGTPNLVVILENKGGVIGFKCNYHRDIQDTKSIWLRRALL
jgi:hypothetical protein